MAAHLAAIDLGASSGRVITGSVIEGRLLWREQSRFKNPPILVPSDAGPRLKWSFLGLWHNVSDGLRRASSRHGGISGIGVDSWAVDYGLLRPNGDLLGPVASYRCPRTDGVVAKFFQQVDSKEAYHDTGLQVQPFNTIFQLLAEDPFYLENADRLLLVPDLMNFYLTGRSATEVTNASTTGIIDPISRQWSTKTIDILESIFVIPVRKLLTELIEPGTRVGEVRADVIPDAGHVYSVGSHDTASAVVAIPAERDDFAYISCGTWSLVGLELDYPVLTEDARLANYTNELGVDSKIRFLKNVMGLWVFNESVRTWSEQGLNLSIKELLKGAAQNPAGKTIIDINDMRFLPPGDMPALIRTLAAETDQPVPNDPYSITRVIIDSLAFAYRKAIHQAGELAGQDIGLIHMVGGGINNELLCQTTADALGMSVLAGPVEATALGNLAVLARATGAVSGGLTELRGLIRNSERVRIYQPDTSALRLWSRVVDAHRASF